MTITNIIEVEPGVYRATINGMVWSGITSASRFWAPLQEAIAGGATVTKEY